MTRVWSGAAMERPVLVYVSVPRKRREGCWDLLMNDEHDLS